MKNKITLILLIVSINVISIENENEKFDKQSMHIHVTHPSTIKIDRFGYGESLIIYGTAKKYSYIAEYISMLENDKETKGVIVKVLEIIKNKDGELDFKLSYIL